MLRMCGWLLTTIFLFLSIASCAPTRPGWISQPPQTSSLYIQGLGIAKSTGDRGADQRRADDLARAEIARQIRVTVSSRLTDVKREDSRTGITQDTEQVVESSVSLTLDGVVIKERHYDRETDAYYALAVLNRGMAAQRVGEKIRAAANRAEEQRRSGERHIQEGDMYRYLMALFQAAEERAAVTVEEDIYRALASNSVDAMLEAEGAASLFSPTLAQIENEIGALISSLSFHIVSGDRQRIDRGRVADALTARLDSRFNDVTMPAAGFPVRFHVTQGMGRLDERRKTGAQGEAASGIYQAGTCGEPACIIVATIDTAAVRTHTGGLQSDGWIERLGGIAAQFTLLPGAFGFEDGIADLACRISRPLHPTTSIVVDRFTYQDTRIAGPFTAPLRKMINADLAALGRGRVIERVNLSADAGAYGDPNANETLARMVRADAVVWGDYWERGDSVVVHARVTGAGGARIASADIVMPRNAIPHTIRPPVLNADLPEAPADGLPVKIWTARGDGGLYVEGERLTVYVQAETEGRLRLLYRQADGQIIQIFPNVTGGDDRVQTGQVYTIPGEDASYDFVIRPPFGVEYLIAVTGAEPFPRMIGREVNGGVLLRGTVKDVVQRLTGDIRDGRYGQSVVRLTTVGQ